MGGCQSTSTSTSTPGNNAAVGHQNQDKQKRNGKNKQRNQQPPKREIESLVRVGSKVLTNSPNQSHLEAVRASSYDHVHAMVMTSFDDAARSRGAGIVGLRNLGNTCFLNSSLQCLSNTIPLTDYFLGYDYRKEINYSNVLGTHGKLVNAYTLLMKQLWLQTTSKTLNPSAFYRQLTKFAPQFGGGGQHDAQEVLAFLLDGIHEDLNRVKDRPYIQDKDCDGTNDQGDAILAWQNYLLRNRSIVVDLFQGQLRNTMTCRNNNRRTTTTRTAGGAKQQQGCGHQNIKFEPFMYLSLPISTNCITLQDCLDLYCSTEHLTGENQWYCPSCRMHVDATKKLDLWMLPPILIIHLKRFDQRGKKIETPIFYPTENWDLSAAVKSKSGLPPHFDLYAVSNHSGNLNGGHYTALCRNRFDNYWYEMNDSTTTRLCVGNKPDNCNPKAYCLFYNRVETRSRTTPDNVNHLKVRRQSVDRPELWPHMQLTTDFASFRRSTVVTDMPPPPPPAVDQMSTIHEA